MMDKEQMPCPFCGSRALYEGYHDIDGFEQPMMFCNGCKAMFTVEGSEDWVTNERDGMDKLRAAWNRRANVLDGKTISTAYVEVAPRFNWELMAQELEQSAEMVREMAGDE